MGFSLSWIAIRGKTPTAILAQLGLRGTGHREEIFESKFDAAELHEGWYVVIADHDDRFMRDEVVQAVTQDCEAVTCFIEEHVMVSAAAGWKYGLKIWTVCHHAEKSIDHLETSGTLPQQFAAIRDARLEMQSTVKKHPPDVDYVWSIPVDLAKALTGFQHDFDIEGVGPRPFEVLVELNPAQFNEQDTKPTLVQRFLSALGIRKR